MHPTHALAPCLLLTGRYPAQVYGRGSGRIREELQQQYHCPFAFESAFVSLENSDLTIEMERFLYGVARSYSECFRVYGEKSSFEWQQLESEMPVLYSRTCLLYTSIAKFWTCSDTYPWFGDPCLHLPLLVSSTGNCIKNAGSSAPAMPACVPASPAAAKWARG